MNPAGSSGSIDFVICARFICAVCVSFSFFSFGSTDWTIFQHNSTYSFILIKFTLWCDACVCVDVTIDCAVKAYYVREFMLMSRTCCGLCERFPCENREREREGQRLNCVYRQLSEILYWSEWNECIASAATSVRRLLQQVLWWQPCAAYAYVSGPTIKSYEITLWTLPFRTWVSECGFWLVYAGSVSCPVSQN